MVKNHVVTAVAVLVTAVTVNSSAQNIDSKASERYHGHLTVQLGDVVVKQGEIARPMYSYSIDAWVGPERTRQFQPDLFVDIKSNYCIDGLCHYDTWQKQDVRYDVGLHIKASGMIDLKKVMEKKGTYNSTFRIHSESLGCDVTAVGTIFVE